MKILDRLHNILSKGRTGCDGGPAGRAGRPGQSGQALAEATIVIALLIIIVSGVLDLGRAYYTYLAMQNAAAEGAAYGSFHPVDEADPNNVEYRTRNESPSGLLDWSAADVQVEAPFTTPGNKITVTIGYEYELLTPVLIPIAGETLSLSASSVQTIQVENAVSP